MFEKLEDWWGRYQVGLWNWTHVVFSVFLLVLIIIGIIIGVSLSLGFLKLPCEYYANTPIKDVPLRCAK